MELRSTSNAANYGRKRENFSTTAPPGCRASFFGRSLKDDEMLGLFTFRNPEPVRELSLEEWDKEMNEIIDLPKARFSPMRPSSQGIHLHS